MLFYKQFIVTLFSKNSKIMVRKIAFLFCVLSFCCFGSKAQFKLPKVFVAFHGIYAAPQDDKLANNFHFGLGADAEAGFGFGKNMITASLGYINFTAMDNKNGSLSYLPLEVGYRRYFFLGLFADAKVGVALQSIPDKSTSLPLDNSTNLLYELGGGFKVMGIEATINFASSKNSNGNAATWSNNFLYRIGYCLKI